jgi:transposase InsO family protein
MTVSRSCYYEWLDSPKTEREKKNEALIEILKVLFEKGRGTYGTRRLKNKLAEQGVVVSRQRIGRLMRQAGLWCKTKKLLKQRPTLNIISRLHLTC